MQKGVIIHWGIYSVPAFSPERKNKKKSLYNGSEWYLGRLKNPFIYGKETVNYHNTHYPDLTYYDFLPIFEKESENWNPQKWIDLFLKIGVSYIIFTAKHHDGVCMYPSKYGEYHTRRDYVGELCKLAKENGLKFGIYYSLMEFKRKNTENFRNNIVYPQLKEIIKRYEPDILWADGDWIDTVKGWDSFKFLMWLNKNYPNIKVNSRWGKDFISIRKNNEILREMSFVTPTDRFIPFKKGEYDKWEHINTISSSWGFNKNQNEYKTAKEIILLCKKVEELKGSYFTINLGPQPNEDFDKKEERVISLINFKNCNYNFKNPYIDRCIKSLAKKYKVSENDIINIVSIK